MSPFPIYYRGSRFRSEIEARWAVFWDEVKVLWEYEKRPFPLNTGFVVPSFWLPEVRGGVWVEVVASYPEPWQQEMAEELAQQTKQEVFFLGEVSPPGEESSSWDSAMVFFPENGCFDVDYWWCQCRHCKRVGLEFQGDASRFCQFATSWEQEGEAHATPALVRAYRRAQTVQFPEPYLRLVK